MKVWSLTLHGPGGILSQIDSPEAQFVIGTEEAPDVLTVAGEGVAPRHAWVWITESGLQVEDLACGTLVNGHPIEGRVEAEYPASVQVGAVTLVVEVKESVVVEEAAAAGGAADADASAANASCTGVAALTTALTRAASTACTPASAIDETSTSPTAVSRAPTSTPAAAAALPGATPLTTQPPPAAAVSTRPSGALVRWRTVKIGMR